MTAFTAKDTTTIMSLYVPDQSLIVFDATVPLQYTGAAAYTKDWNEFLDHVPRSGEHEHERSGHNRSRKCRLRA